MPHICLDMFGRLRHILLTIAFLLIGSTTTWADKNFILVIDPGHGGHDAGAVGGFSKEKDINLQVALAFGNLVEQNCPDVKVIYTRKTDIFIPLDTRADIANNAKADLFISVHTNSLPAGRIAYGSETYTLGMARAGANLEVAKRENSVITYEKDYQTRYQGFDPNKAESYVIFEFMQDKFMRQSIDLARCIQKHYVRANRKDKGVHQAGFLVLRKTSMPAVLTELGFISTPEEETFLNSKAPDANFTLRMTYGHVKAMKPRDGVLYDWRTTLKGMFEKEDSTNIDYIVHPRMRQLYEARDFGRYAREDGQLPTCFISNNDITGGNSGSPVMNAKGELIGLAFDGNIEALSSDLKFDPELQRCINVDIRYVLWILDKFGESKYLFNEMEIH